MTILSNFVQFHDFEIKILQLFVSFEQLSNSFKFWRFWTCNLKGKKLILQLLSLTVQPLICATGPKIIKNVGNFHF
jgi:hypothetical protein